jgi:hypothetical protein
MLVVTSQGIFTLRRSEVHKVGFGQTCTVNTRNDLLGKFCIEWLLIAANYKNFLQNKVTLSLDNSFLQQEDKC